MNSFEKKLGKECTALNILLRQKNKGTYDYFCMHIFVIFELSYAPPEYYLNSIAMQYTYDSLILVNQNFWAKN